MKVFNVKLTTADYKEHIEFVSAEDELEAIDKVVEAYKEQEILDVEVI